MKFKLWQEDFTQAPNSGRRFRCIYSQSPRTRRPYVSLDFKNIGNETFIALATRDGIVSLLEPTEPDNLATCREVEQFYACDPVPRRGEDTNFKVCFDPNVEPCFNAVIAGLSPKALSLAVASTNVVRVYRAERARNGDYHFVHGVLLVGHQGLVRDVAWAPGSARGIDWIATSCSDGFVRIFEVSTPHNRGFSSPSLRDSIPTTQAGVDQASAPRNAVSGIGAAVAGQARSTGEGPTGAHAGQVAHDAVIVADLPHDNAWNLRWIPNSKLPFRCTLSAYMLTCYSQHASLGRRRWAGPDVEDHNPWRVG